MNSADHKNSADHNSFMGRFPMAQQKKILMVATSQDRIDNNHLTGLWLEELAIPYLDFKSNGFEVEVVSIQGGKVPIDPQSQATPEQATMWTEVMAALLDTPSVTSIEARGFDAIFLPGGHGTMFDLPSSKDLQLLLREFAESDKIIAAVCHGPAAFVGATYADGTPLVSGKTLTSFTDDEERATGLEQLMPFLLETKLRELGASFVSQVMWSDHIEQDGNFITGQNPQSSSSVAQAVIQALKMSAA
jgi:putative intracellular protease/amidase